MTVKDVRDATGGPVDWDALPDILTVRELRPVLRLGRDGVYRWMHAHPGLVMRTGTLMTVPREALRRFLAGDPEVRQIAFTDPYARPDATAPTSFLRVS